MRIASRAEYRRDDYHFQRELKRDGVPLERSRPVSTKLLVYIVTAVVFFAVGGALNLFF